MSAYYQEFEELHKLLDRKLGDLRHCYRIEGQQTPLSAYDIFNSQKVNDYLRREGGNKSLVPGDLDEKLLQKRFATAFKIVSQDHGLQNEDPAFCANAQKILNKAREILKDRQKELAYSAWVRARFRAETEPIEAEKARREAEEERQKRKELEARLAEKEKISQQAEEEKQKRKALEEKLAEAERERCGKIGNFPRYITWLGIFLVVGLFLQLSHQHTASNQVATNRATPNEPPPQPEISATPKTSPSVTSESTPSVTPNISPRLTPEPTPSLAPEPTPSLPLKATPNPPPDATWPDGRILTHPENFVNSRVVNVMPNDRLKLRGGPGTRFSVIAEIPGDATDILAFGQDQVWDGDTWWCPVEWGGFRGYVGRRYLPTDPRPTPAANTAMWPDGRSLTHPEHFVNTDVVNVQPNDTLKLRAGPGTRFNAVAEIPGDATDILAFDQDQVWDGDTWWCPVEWRGFRGYVGRSHLPTAH
jgi:hypothetical protein